jgi:hypothetical protein
MTVWKMQGDWAVETHYGHRVLAEGTQAEDLRGLIRAHIDSRGETISRLAIAAAGAGANGTELHEFLAKRRRISPKRADAIVKAITDYPKGFASSAPMPAMAYARSAEYRMRQELNANRDAAAQRRAAHIEACRQAEIAKYGFTTITGDVMDQVA